jgi:hypothetical protein
VATNAEWGSNAEGGAEESMLTVSEETMLLLYTRVRPAGGRDEYDTLSRYGGELRLLAGAVLMDLVLLGKVQIRPVSPATRRLLATSRLLFFLLIVALFFVLPLLPSVSRIRLPGMLTLESALPLGLFIVFLLGAVASAAFGRVVGDQLTLLDRMPTGDLVLDEAVARSARVGQHASLRTYLRAFRLRALSKLTHAVIAQLEQQGLLSLPTSGPTVFGLLDRRHVQRERPEFAAIGAHLRRLVLDHTEVETHAVALLLLFAWSGRIRSFGTPVAAGIYQFFTPAEYPQLTALLRSLRRGESTLAAQLHPGLYEALRAIAVVVRQLSARDS